MANDLRDRNFTPYKPSPKAAQQQNAGCAAALVMGIGVMLTLIGLMSAVGGAGTGGAVLSVIGVFLLGRGVTMAKAAGKQGSRPAARPAPKAAAKPAPRKAPAKEPECPNPEPHRHYEAAPKKREYDTFVVRDKKWPTPEERRRENMRNLYDAGLLTKEEYDEELRKIKG